MMTSRPFFEPAIDPGLRPPTTGATDAADVCRNSRRSIRIRYFIGDDYYYKAHNRTYRPGWSG
jgi:hypothetical protein